MLGVTRSLPIEYFVFVGLVCLAIITYIVLKKDKQAAKVFLFGTCLAVFYESLAIILGTRVYEPLNWWIFALVVLSEGGGAFAFVWLIATKIYNKWFRI